MSDFLPFARPEIGEEEIVEVAEVLRSGWLTTGPKAKRFEEDFAAFLGGGIEAVAVNSATAGLHLALEALGIGPGDEIITTTYTFTATAEVVRYLGAHPILVDIDPATLNIDPSAIERAITPRTRAIIPVHLAGHSCDMHAIFEIARRYDLKVIEDAAHALPARFGDRLIGTLDSDATVFSFYANKTITTGEGGMIVTRNAAVASRCRTMRLHGISRDAFDRFTSVKPSWAYEVVAPGFKYNLTDVAAAIGIHQLRKAERFRRRRAELAAAYHTALRGLPLVLPSFSALSSDAHAWHLYIVRLAESACVGRDVLIERMATAGIGCSVHYIPLHLHPYWRDTYALTPQQFPHAQRAYEAAVSLPLYSLMDGADVARVAAALYDILS